MRISVVVIAYNRREFLREALESALNQTMPKEEYEIILAKNFEDEDTEKFAEANGIRTIHSSEQTIGKMTMDAAKLAKGEIVSFLDDDDLFVRDKLVAVSATMSDENIGYLHNNVKVFGDAARLKQINRPSVLVCERSSVKDLLRLIDNGATFNSSSISVRREVLTRWKTMVETCSVGPGFTLFFASLLSSKLNVLDTRPMTLYRRHASGSHPAGTSSSRRSDFAENLRGKVDAIQTVIHFSKPGICAAAANYKLNETVVRLAIYRSVRVGRAERQSIGVLLGVPTTYRPWYRFLLIIAAHVLPRVPPSISDELLASLWL